MRYLLACAAVMVVLATDQAKAQLEVFVEVCQKDGSDAREVIHFCQRAVDTGQLPPQAEAQVRSNMGTGYFEIGQYRSAIEQYSAAIDIDPTFRAAFFNRARAYEKERRLTEAAADYQALLDLDPNDADAYIGRGAMLLSFGDPARAVRDLTTAIGLQPSWIAPLFNRGVAFLQLGDFPAAEQDFTNVISRNAQDSGAYLNRGRARAAMGSAGAAEDFDYAVEIDPEWAGAWFARGQFLDSLGDREAANSDFRRAWELGYSDPWLIERIRQISG